MLPYIYALAANFSFGLGSQIFTKFSRKLSPVWMTVFKDWTGCLLFLMTVLLTGGFSHVDIKYAGAFILSGILGLTLCDMMLLFSFAKMGPGRTLMLYSFQPLFLGIAGWFLFGQSLSAVKLLSIIFFIACVFTFAFESFKKHRKWNVKIIFIAFVAMLLDAAGVLITRYAFDGSGLGVIEGNFYRCLGSVFIFGMILPFVNVNFLKKFKRIKTKAKIMAGAGAFLGVYLALIFYLAAIKTGTLAVVSSIGVTGALFAALFECMFEKKWPSKYLIAATAFFGVGMFLLL